MNDKIDVLAVIESRRNRDGILDDAGRALDAARRFAARNSTTDGVGELWDAVRVQAACLASAADSLKKAGRVPAILRRASRAKFGGAK